MQAPPHDDWPMGQLITSSRAPSGKMMSSGGVASGAVAPSVSVTTSMGLTTSVAGWPLSTGVALSGCAPPLSTGSAPSCAPLSAAASVVWGGSTVSVHAGTPHAATRTSAHSALDLHGLPKVLVFTKVSTPLARRVPGPASRRSSVHN